MTAAARAGRAPRPAPPPRTDGVERSILAGVGPSATAIARVAGEQEPVLGRLGREQAARALTAGLVGLGPLAPLVDDPAVTDVLVNGDGGVWVERGRGVEPSGVEVPVADLRPLAVRLAGLAGRRLDDAQPWVDGLLPGGVRLHAVLPPLVEGGPHVSLRVARRRFAGVGALVAAGAVSPAAAEVLRGLVAARRSLLVTGGTGAGKTTVLGALLAECPPGERIVVVEDVRELDPQHPHVVRLQGRAANVEGVGAVSLSVLVRQALRMRPDRLVVGEVRGGEVRDLLAALNTGHDGGAGTLHANGPEEVPARLEALGSLVGMPRAAVHAQLRGALHAVVHVVRGADGRRLDRIGVPRVGPDGFVDVVVALSDGPDGLTRGPAWADLSRLLPGPVAVTALAVVLAVVGLLAWPRRDVRSVGTPGGGRGAAPGRAGLARLLGPVPRRHRPDADWVADLAEVAAVGLRAGLDLPSAVLVAARTPAVARAAPWLEGRVAEAARRGAGVADVLDPRPGADPREGRPAAGGDLAVLALAWRLTEETGAGAVRTTAAAAAALRARTADRQRRDALLAGPRASMRVLTALPLGGPARRGRPRSPTRWPSTARGRPGARRRPGSASPSPAGGGPAGSSPVRSGRRRREGPPDAAGGRARGPGRPRRPPAAPGRSRCGPEVAAAPWEARPRSTRRPSPSPSSRPCCGAGPVPSSRSRPSPRSPRGGRAASSPSSRPRTGGASSPSGRGPGSARGGRRRRWPGTPHSPPGRHRPTSSRRPRERMRVAEARRVEAALQRAGVLLVLPLGVCFLPGFVATTVVPVVLVLLGALG